MDLSGTDEAFKQENDMLAMLYRRHVEFVVGHGVAVHADVDPTDTNRAVRITSRAIPSYEVPKTTPPTIAHVEVNPSTIYQNSCSSFTQTATITVETQDIGGISTIQAVWSIGSESGTVVLSHVEGNTYQGTIGPISTKGTVNIHGSAVDNSSNWTPFITTLEVDCCVC